MADSPAPSSVQAPSSNVRAAVGGAPTGAAVCVVFLAFVLRLAGLGQQSLWFDEAFSVLLARRGLAEIVADTAKDTMPPLYYWLLHFWGTGPSVDFYPRSISLLAGTLSVALVYLVGRALLDARTGLAGALVAAVSPFHVYFSQETRMYALLGVWVLMAAYGFVLGWQRGRPVGWALYGGGTLLAVYTHALGWLPSAALLLWAGAGSAKHPEKLLPPIAGLGAAFVVYLPWFLVVLGQASKVFSSFWAGAASPLSPVASLYLFFMGPLAGANFFPIALALVLLALGLTVPTALRSSHPNSGQLRLLWAWAAFPPLALMALSLVQPVYLERVLIGAAFPVYLLLGWVITSLPFSKLGAVLGVLILGAGLWGMRNSYTYPALAKPPMREAAALARWAWQAGGPVLHTSDGSLLPFLLYAPELPNLLLEGDPEYALHTARVRSTVDSLGITPVSAAHALNGARRFLLIVSPDHSVAYQEEAAREFDARYQRLSNDVIGGIIVRSYAVR